MVFLACLLLLQVPNGQRVSVTQSKSSGTLPFSIVIPKSWVKGGTWPHMKTGDADLDYQCGPDATMTLSVTVDPAETQTKVNSSYDIVKRKHPEDFWTIDGPLGKGVMIKLALHGRKVAGAEVDHLTGKCYYGDHRVAFFEWGSTSHAASAADRKLISAMIASIKPGK